MPRRNNYVSIAERNEQITRDMLLDVAAQLMQTKGMEALTVRNVCQRAGISTGSFYNLFDNKDALIGAYLRREFARYKREMDSLTLTANSAEKICLIFRYFVQCCTEIDLNFAREVYSSFSDSVFNFVNRGPEDSLILDKVREYVEEGKKNGEIKSSEPTNIILLRMTIIVTGYIYYWCVLEGDFDVAYQTDAILRDYLYSIVTSDKVTINLAPLPRKGLFSEY